jgi:hypothetical protein
VNPRAEAVAQVGGRYDARVLEPSPPAVAEAPWYADDPVGRGEPRGALPRLSPVAGAELRWDELASGDGELAEWCARRWLGAYRPLEPVPASLVATREALHRLAERVMAPARRHANGKIGLRYTRGGFGTPFFGEDVQLRVSGETLVVQTRERERAAPITSLAAAATHIGEQLLPESVADDTPLAVDASASAFLGDWYGFGASVLEELRSRTRDEDEPSRVQLWPEHFDIAVEIGLQDTGARANYGASSGDADHDEPYLYVGPWSGVEGLEDLFEATAFPGAELGYAELLRCGDGYAQRETALDFFTRRLEALAARAASSAD